VLCYARTKGSRIEIVTNPAGHCCVCLTDEFLTWHHVFGRSARIVMRLCDKCHKEYHCELDRLNPGTITQMVLDVFGYAMWPVQSGYALSDRQGLARLHED